MSEEIVSAATALLGTWKCDNAKSERIEDFLAAVGVNFVIRKLAKMASPTMIITIEDGRLVVKLESGFTTRINRLPLDGSTVEEDDMGGRFTNSIGVKGGKLTFFSKSHDPKAPVVEVTREVVGNELIQLMNVLDRNLIAKRVFVREAS